MKATKNQTISLSMGAAAICTALFAPGTRAQVPQVATQGAVGTAAPDPALLEARVATPSEPSATMTEDRQDNESWIHRYPPQDDLIEVGVFLGPVFISDNNSFRSPPVYNADAPPIVRPFTTFKQPAVEIGLRGGYYPLSFLGGELEGMLTSAESDTEDGVTIIAARAQAVVQLPYWSIVPFAVGGIGYWNILNDRSGDDSDPAFHYGIGAKANITRNVAVRIDLRDSITNQRGEESYPHNIEALAGAGLVFGREDRVELDTDHDGILDDRDGCPLEPGLPANNGCPIRDTDRDGILDPDDQCVNEPGLAPTGCPIRDADKDGVVDELDLCVNDPGVAPTGCPDSDQDGFLDRDDKCPTVAGVAPDGCPGDPDGDGLVGAADRCPDQPETKNGFEDSDGCPDELPKEIKDFMGVIAGIEFDRNKADIRATSEFVLAKAASILKEYPSLRVEIVGHTDARGSRELNLDLSLRRAQAVMENLAVRGIDPGRLEARGAGPDEPLTENDTPAGRQKNRRIEFRVIEGKGVRTEPASP